MKEMIKKIREEKGGFTLAELLIVVAIVLVLVAIAVPVFTGALGEAKEAVLRADSRSAKAEASMEYLLNDREGSWAYAYTVSNNGDIKLEAPVENGNAVDPTQDDKTKEVKGTVVISANDVSKPAA